MSAFNEFKKEQQDIDAYLEQGFSIVGLREDLDGTEVHFLKKRPDSEHAVLLLLNPDSRKYVTALIHASST